MQIVVSRDEFAAATAWIARNLDTRPTHPLLGAIRLDVTQLGDRDVLRASGYTADTTTQADIPATDVSRAGQVLVSGALLAAVAKVLPDRPVELTADGPLLRITCGTSQSSLPVIDLDNVPVLPDMPELIGQLPTRDLLTAIGHVLGAAGTDSALPVFTGIYIEVNDGLLRLVASDRYRLAVRDLAWQPAITTAGQEPIRLLVPARALHELARGMDDTAVIRIGASADGTVVGLTDGTRQATARLIDAPFPNYRKLVPEAPSRVVEVAVAAVVDAITRVSVLADHERDEIRCQFTEDGHVEISSGGDGHGGARETVPIKLTGHEIRMDLMAHRLLGALNAITTPIARIEFTEDRRPLLIREHHPDQARQHDDSGHLQLVMPLRPLISQAAKAA